MCFFQGSSNRVRISRNSCVYKFFRIFYNSRDFFPTFIFNSIVEFTYDFLIRYKYFTCIPVKSKITQMN